MSERITEDELRQFIERIERMNIEIKEKSQDRNEIYGEAKGRGYDTKIMRKIVRLRKRNPDDIANEQATTDMYAEALGMSV